MALHESFCDAQSQARGRFATGGTRGQTGVTVEHPRLVLFRETRTLVLDMAFHLGGVALHVDGNVLFGRRELDGVGNNIVEHLFHRGRIGVYESAFGQRNVMEDNFLGAGGFLVLTQRMGNGGGKIEGFEMDFEAAIDGGIGQQALMKTRIWLLEFQMFSAITRSLGSPLAGVRSSRSRALMFMPARWFWR